MVDDIGESAQRVYKVRKQIGDKVVTLEIFNNDFSPTAKTNSFGVNPLAVMVAGYEGLYLKPYFCEAGKETIGFGHRPKKGDHAPEKISIDDAFTYLHDDLAKSAAELSKQFHNWDDIIPATQGALTSLKFNTSGIKDHLADSVKEGSGDAIKQYLGMYNTFYNPADKAREVSNGLANRRKSEQDVMDASYGNVWQKTLLEDDSLIDKLFAKGATPEQVGQIFEGIGKIEIVEKGKVIFKSKDSNEVGETQKTIVDLNKLKAPAATNPVMVAATVIKPEIAAEKDEAAARKEFLLAKADENQPMHHAVHKAREMLHKAAEEKAKKHGHAEHGKAKLQPFTADISLHEDSGTPNPGSAIRGKNNPVERLI